MLFRLIGLAIVSGALLAQTATEQLQKAIYAQDTTGDLDGAIATYRQILSSGQPQRVVAATAQFRLAQALLMKGDTDAGMKEAQKLATDYPEYRDLLLSLGRRLTAVTLQKRASRGTATDYQHYKHNRTGAELTAPFGTSFLNDSASSDGGDMVMFGGHQYTVAVWLQPEEHAVGELAGLLRQDLELKHTMRGPDWKPRPGSVVTGVTANGQWLSAVADDTQGGKNMVELLTWYRTAKTHAVFLTTVEPSKELEVQAYLAKMVAAAIIP
jgi:tetratricopeptide (TPR) repeat protein